jgi:hypothetical protein
VLAVLRARSEVAEGGLQRYLVNWGFQFILLVIGEIYISYA